MQSFGYVTVFSGDPTTFVMLNEVKHLGTARRVTIVSSPHTHRCPDPSLSLRMTE